ncbi:MAG: response regulator [Candidatus Nealsonbacteria bacterium]
MKNILLIEDDPFLSDIYSTKLKRSGFDVRVAIDGEDAFEKIKEKMPDLALLDIVLPNIDGWEFLRKIKKDSALSSLKIVILSNLGQKKEIEKGLELGAEKYLIKAHYTPSEVVREVVKILK